MTSDVHRGAPERIERSILVLAVLGAMTALLIASWRESTGVVLGASASWLNFRWMRTSVTGLANRLAADSKMHGSTLALAARFLLRYAVLGGAVYATLKGSVVSGLGVVAGLLLIVPALMAEAGYEFYLSQRHNTRIP